jgi:hypothetical protein
VIWQDNLDLLSAYFRSAERIRDTEGRCLRTLDVSTGPCLAPLMATMRCISEITLSDYDPTNREWIAHSSIDYWYPYAQELVRLFPTHDLSTANLLERLNLLRAQSPPLDVDLRRSPVFIPNPGDRVPADLVTMHFVVDSICDTKQECFEMLERVSTLVSPQGWLLFSSLMQSSWWLLGESKQPSPVLTEKEMDQVLDRCAFQVVDRFRSSQEPKVLYEGGWTVFLCKKDT